MGNCVNKSKQHRAFATKAKPEIGVLYNDTIEFVLPLTEGVVVKVYDGDTITIATRIFDQPELYRFNVRLAGIDAPEMKSIDPEEKEIAKKVQGFLSDLVLGKTVQLKNVAANEKYGRVLADVYCDKIHVNRWMIEQHLAVPYDGKTKIIPSNWSEYFLNGYL